MPCQSLTTNPAPISVQPGTTYKVACNSHAAFFQQVILSFNQDLSNPLGTFSGSGEGVAMLLADGCGVLPITTGGNTTLFAQFNFSQFGPQGPFQPANTVCAPVITEDTFISVTSEDSADDDTNDSYLFLATNLNASDVKKKGS